MADWITFFDSDHAIYVNARHKNVHAVITGDGMLAHIRDGDRVLDYGCGEAAYAGRLIRKAGQLTLCEAAPNLREALKRRVAHERHISVLSPEDVAALPDQSFEVVIMHSVSQYLSPAQLAELLATFRRLLRPDGKLVIGDVVQPDTPAWKDALVAKKNLAAIPKKVSEPQEPAAARERLADGGANNVVSLAGRIRARASGVRARGLRTPLRTQ